METHSETAGTHPIDFVYKDRLAMAIQAHHMESGKIWDTIPALPLDKLLTTQ